MPYTRAIVPPTRFAPRRRRRSSPSSISTFVETVAAAIGIRPKKPQTRNPRRHSDSSCAPPKSILKRRSVDSDVSLTESGESVVNDDDDESDFTSYQDVENSEPASYHVVPCRHRGLVRIPVLPPPERDAGIILCREGAEDDASGRVRFLVPDTSPAGAEAEEETPSWDQF